MATITIHLSREQLIELLQGQDPVIEIIGQTNQPATTNSQQTADPSFLDFFANQISRLEANGNLRTIETYRTAHKKFRSFLDRDDLSFAAVNSDLMLSFQTFLRSQDLSLNTVSFYMRILRAVYHLGVEQGLVADQRPFRHVYTGMAKTAKRAISLNEIRLIKQLPLTSSRMRFSRDMFLLSFYMRGMAFVDMAYLKTDDIKEGILSYRRHKTGQLLRLRWEEDMQEIVNRYPSKTGKYLLPIIHCQNGKERNQYRNHQSKINEDLKAIAKMVGIGQNLTMYCSRHSWATIAREMKVPIEVISRGMGHTNERTTEIYLKTIDIKMIDQANRQIMDSL